MSPIGLSQVPVAGGYALSAPETPFGPFLDRLGGGGGQAHRHLCPTSPPHFLALGEDEPPPPPRKTPLQLIHSPIGHTLGTYNPSIITGRPSAETLILHNGLE